MAMAELARHEGANALPLSQIAELQRLPLPYLEQIFVALRRAGLVESARGRTGGYRLSRPGADISIADVLSAVAEETQFTRCHDEAAGCLAGERCITHGLWQGLTKVTAGYLGSVSLAGLINTNASPQVAKSPASARQSDAAHAIHRRYFDYNASAPMRPAVREAFIAALDVTGNASSVHAEGRRARDIIETAREQVAALIKAKPSEVVFTSGASEANAWVMAQGFDTIFASGIEHDSVLAPARASKAHVIEFGAGRDGLARVEDVARHVLAGDAPGRTLVTLQMANNETGAVQDVAGLAAFAHDHGLFMHTDAVQAAGRLDIDFANLPVTTLALSAHKMGGPKGIGALVIRDRVDLMPLLRGGGQERRRRAGTENIAAIAGFGAAAVASREDLNISARIAALRDELEAGIRALTPAAVIIAESAPRLVNTSAIALPGKTAETLVIRLDLAGFAVSAGSACSSGKVGASHVLTSMGVDPVLARAAIRLSLGPDTTSDDIAAFLAAWKDIACQPALAA